MSSIGRHMSRWSKHKEKHKDLVVAGCYYCEHPPTVPGIRYTAVSSRGPKLTKRALKEMNKALVRVFTQPAENIIQPASMADMEALIK